jgi:site-specific DNA-cytosine methylase
MAKRNFSQGISLQPKFSLLVPHIISDSAAANNSEFALYDSLQLDKSGLNKNAFEIAWKGYQKLLSEGILGRDNILSIVDFTQPSRRKRLYILDVKNFKLLMQTFVAHGRKSGLEYARNFSNRPESNKSSLGFYKTLDTYYGDHGLALKLEGLERNYNNNAYERTIVVHGSDYVGEKAIRNIGYQGRSLGCPAVPMKQNKQVINLIKDGSCLFIYYPQKDYLSSSRLINS